MTRELSRLVREGLLERAGRSLVLRDVAALERLAGDVRPEAEAAAAPVVHEARAFDGVAPPRQRRAILVAEMSDSIALMERDEERTVERCRTFLAHATSQIVPTHAGRSMLKVPADGFIAEFPDAAQALRCAFELHADLARFNTHRDAAPLGMRAGIHVAEVIVEAFNVLGDGVNLAAGLAELANPGETVVSTQARDQLTSGVDASVEDLGEQRLRNRSRAVRAFRAWPPAQTRVWTPSAAVQAHGRPSIAVIPFQLRSDDPRFESIGDGLADDTIAALSRMADFFVVSRLSTMAFRHAPIGVRRIGEMLGVQYVLSGSVQIAYPRALLVAELADARDGRIVWSQRFQGDVADVFALQVELARKVVQSLAPFVRSARAEARAHHELRSARRVRDDATRRRADASPGAAKISCRRAPPSRLRSRAIRSRRARTLGLRSGTSFASLWAPARMPLRTAPLRPHAPSARSPATPTTRWRWRLMRWSRAGRGTISTQQTAVWLRRWPRIRTSPSPGYGAGSPTPGAATARRRYGAPIARCRFRRWIR